MKRCLIIPAISLTNKYVKKDGDQMTSLEVPNITVPGDIVVDNGSQIKSGSDIVITFGGAGARYLGAINVSDHLINKDYANLFDPSKLSNLYVSRAATPWKGS